jgi:hypothetical protein
MTRRNKALVAVLSFNAITALAGGIGLIFGGINPPSEWLEHTFFYSYLIPGLVLFFIVGGSASFGAFSVLKNKTYFKQAAGLSGLIMMIWIVAEIIMIRHFHWLQALYYITGYMVTALSYPSEADLLKRFASTQRRHA